MISIGNIALVFIWFIITFSLSLRFSTSWTDKLFKYHDYENFRKKKSISKTRMFFIRIWKILQVYLYLGTSLGLIIYFIGILFPPIRTAATEIGPTQTLAGASFIISFLTIILLRVIILSDKNKMCSRYLCMDFISKWNKGFDYKKQKDFLESFLFSLIFISVFGTLIYFGTIFITQGILELNFGIKLTTTFFVYILLFILLVGFITIITEFFLKLVGVHKEYSIEFLNEHPEE